MTKQWLKENVVIFWVFSVSDFLPLLFHSVLSSSSSLKPAKSVLCKVSALVGTRQSMSAIFLRKSNHERGKEWGQWLINMSLEAAMYSCFHLWHVGPSVIRSYTTLAVWCFSASPECLLPKFPLVTSFFCWKLNFFVVKKPSVQTEGCQLCIFTLLPNH